VDDDVAYRLLRLEQRLASYEQLYVQELGEMRQELDGLKRQVVLRVPRRSKTVPFVDITICNGCGQCVTACAQGRLELSLLDGHRIATMTTFRENERLMACAECQVGTAPCVTACAPGAITLW
jgi:ferredoxin